MTCYETNFITFEFYLTPFQTNLWLGILIAIVTVVATLSIYTNNPGSSALSYSSWALVLGTVFDEAGSIPENIEKKPFHRLVFGSWALMAIFLTNCYTGVITTELNAPLPGVQPETWWDLICGDRTLHAADLPKWLTSQHIYWYWNEIMEGVRLVVKDETYQPLLKNPYQVEDCFRLLSPPGQGRPFYFNESGILVPTTYFFSTCIPFTSLSNEFLFATRISNSPTTFSPRTLKHFQIYSFYDHFIHIRIHPNYLFLIKHSQNRKYDCK